MEGNKITIRRARNGFIIDKSWYGEVIVANLEELIKEIKEAYEE